MTVLVPDALETNKAGRLTDVQRQNLRAMSRGTRRTELWLAIVLAVVGLLVWFGAGPPQYAALKPLVGIGLLIIAGFLLVRSLAGADPLTEDVRAGKVMTADGPVTKWTNTVHGRRSSTTTHYVQVQNVRVETGAGAYKAIPDAGMVRLYFLPRSHQLVNFEQLADAPLPEGAMTDPKVVLQDAKAALVGQLFGDPLKTAQARAEMAAIGNAMKGEFAADGSAPPASARDPRPLAQAIVGTWRNPMMTLAFTDDGTASMTSAMGMRQEGHWSVDGNGRLLAEIAGSSEPADAWIVGDRLTVVLQKQSLSFERVS